MVDTQTGAHFSELLPGAYKPQPPLGAAASQPLAHKGSESKRLAHVEPGPQELKVMGGKLSGLVFVFKYDNGLEFYISMQFQMV